MSFIASILLWDLWCLFSLFSSFPDGSEIREIFPRTETIRSHNSRAGKPSNLSPVSKEMISDSVELWETAVCFLHIQLIGTNVWLPKTHSVPPEVDFESSGSPAKSESWNSPSLHCLAVFSTWQYCLYSQVWWIYEINRFKRLSEALVHFVMDRESLFTDHRTSGRSILSKYKRFRTIWEHVFDNSPTDFVSSSSKWWSSMHGVNTLWSCWVVLFANSHIVPHISLHDPPCHTTMKKYEYFERMVISLLRNSRFKHGSVIVHNMFAYFALTLSASQVYMIKERCWLSQIDSFVEYFPHRIKILFLSSLFYVIHIHR